MKLHSKGTNRTKRFITTTKVETELELKTKNNILDVYLFSLLLHCYTIKMTFFNETLNKQFQVIRCNYPINLTFYMLLYA